MPMPLIFTITAILWLVSSLFLFLREREISKAPLPSCQSSTLIIATLTLLMAYLASSGNLDLTKIYEQIRLWLAPGWLPLLNQEAKEGTIILKVLFLESIIATIWIYLLRKDDQFSSQNFKIYVLGYLPLWFIFLAGSLFLSDRTCHYFTGKTFIYESVSLYSIPKALTLIHLCLLVPFIEEVFYRGWLLTSLSHPLRPWLANILVALCFTLMHVPYQAQGILATIQVALDTKYFILGLTSLVYGSCYLQNRSLLLNIFLHASYNAFALWLTYGGWIKNV